MSDTTATRPEPPKHDPETLVLKATPRRTVRLKRKLLIGIAAVACGGVLGFTRPALQGPGIRTRHIGPEIYKTERKPPPADSACLPGDHRHIRVHPPPQR